MGRGQKAWVLLPGIHWIIENLQPGQEHSRHGSISLLCHFSTSVVTFLDISYYANLPIGSLGRPYTSLDFQSMCLRAVYTAAQDELT